MSAAPASKRDPPASAGQTRGGADPAAARLLVDLDALADNFAVLRREASGAEVAPVVKADGYGLGAGPIARRLWSEGARTFFVARVGEGEALRAALGPARSDAVVYVLDGCPPGAAGRLSRAGLTPVLNSFAQLEDWSAHARGSGTGLSAAIHVDTGMNRLGLRLDELGALLQAPDRLRGLDVTMVMSHLACASEPQHPMNQLQARRFREVGDAFPGARKSLANSAGVFLGPEFHFDLVRPGICLYGGGPFEQPDARLAPAATLLAPILQVRHVAPGETVGYAASYTAAEPRRLAVVAAGYADGVLRAESPCGLGWLDGQPCPFVGRISMDLLALDVTACEAAAPGAEVELLGAHTPVDLAAAAAGTIAYELLVRLGSRLERSYAGETG